VIFTPRPDGGTDYYVCDPSITAGSPNTYHTLQDANGNVVAWALLPGTINFKALVWCGWQGQTAIVRGISTASTLAEVAWTASGGWVGVAVPSSPPWAPSAGNGLLQSPEITGGGGLSANQAGQLAETLSAAQANGTALTTLASQAASILAKVNADLH
jgi:hypothetical protein